jgi:hypothetical protein
MKRKDESRMDQHNHEEVQEQTENAKVQTRYDVLTRVLIALALLLMFALFDLFFHPPMPVIPIEFGVTGYLTWKPEIILASELFNMNNWKG